MATVARYLEDYDGEYIVSGIVVKMVDDIKIDIGFQMQYLIAIIKNMHLLLVTECLEHQCLLLTLIFLLSLVAAIWEK